MAWSWADRIRGWFRDKPGASVSFDPYQFERLCIEDPKMAHQALAADQRQLAEELEVTYAAYKKRLDDLTRRLSNLSPEEIQHEAAVLREAQDAIRRTLRRIEVSANTARDLEYELSEWEGRKNEPGPFHADHPLTRAEMIRSELAARQGRILKVITPDVSPFRVPEMVDSLPEEDVVASPEREELSAPAQEEGVSERRFDSEIQKSASDPEPVAHVEANHLAYVIRMETREAERWHAVPAPNYEAIEQVRHVKALHAILKRVDREQGIQRNRLEFAPRMRGYDR